MNANTTPAKGDFVRYVGQGYLFYKLAQADVKTAAEKKAADEKRPVHSFTVWQGWLVLPGKHEVQVRAIGSSRNKRYKIELREFPDQADKPEDDWKQLASFEVPAFGDFAYVDGSFKHGDRTYKIRLFKTKDGYIRLRLPQAVNVPAANRAMV